MFLLALNQSLDYYFPRAILLLRIRLVRQAKVIGPSSFGVLDKRIKQRAGSSHGFSAPYGFFSKRGIMFYVVASVNAHMAHALQEIMTNT